MTRAVVLCVILLVFVTQIEMLPVSMAVKVNQMYLSDQGSDVASENEVIADIAKVHVDQMNKSIFGPELPVDTEVLSRVKRQGGVISADGCAAGKLRLYPHGPCVSCEEYIDSTDADDCPINGR